LVGWWPAGAFLTACFFAAVFPELELEDPPEANWPPFAEPAGAWKSLYRNPSVSS
jgi:hypothetical protein